jgi:hypothetical protein
MWCGVLPTDRAGDVPREAGSRWTVRSAGIAGAAPLRRGRTPAALTPTRAACLCAPGVRQGSGCQHQARNRDAVLGADRVRRRSCLARLRKPAIALHLRHTCTCTAVTSASFAGDVAEQTYRHAIRLRPIPDDPRSGPSSGSWPPSPDTSAQYRRPRCFPVDTCSSSNSPQTRGDCAPPAHRGALLPDPAAPGARRVPSTCGPPLRTAGSGACVTPGRRGRRWADGLPEPPKRESGKIPRRGAVLGGTAARSVRRVTGAETEDENGQRERRQ